MSTQHSSNATPVRVLVVGLGNMGMSHARAYAAIEGFALAGFCTRRAAARADLAAEFPNVPRFEDFDDALSRLRPDAAAICTYAETHAEFALKAIAAGAHVFCEKPLADNLIDAEKVAAASRAAKRALMVGYILRVHPSWTRFVAIARTLGAPLAMRMNLNQQSSGAGWEIHKALMRSTSPIVDCGVHYVDVMCQVTGAAPKAVHAVGARLADDIAPTMYNYGHLHIAFEDGSVGWYEAGWGPMMSETAFFVKDIIGAKGSVSIVAASDRGGASSNLEAHTRTDKLRVHHAARDASGAFSRKDEWISTEDEPDHQELCAREQRLFLQAIRGEVDLGRQLDDALNSLRIVLAADESVRTGEVVRLGPMR